MARLSRRNLLKGTAVAGAARLTPPLADPAAAAPDQVRAAAGGATAPAAAAPPAVDPVELHWLEGAPPAEPVGATVGVPWPRGALPRDQTFAMSTPEGAAVAVQSWPIGVWPDGSLKWSAHAVGATTPAPSTLLLAPGTPAAPAARVTVRQSRGSLDVDTGTAVTRINRGGTTLIASITRDGVEIAKAGQLVLLRQGAVADGDEARPARRERFLGEVQKVTVEQTGPVRAVVRVEGRHRAARGGRRWLPFTVRMYWYAGAEHVRMVHTFVYDGDPTRDFIAGLGVRFAVPLRDAPHDRHVRFVSADGGVLAEAVRGITGLRRDPGAAVRAAQVAGGPTPDVSTWDTRVSGRLELIPAWGDHTLSQLCADGYTIRKRTKPGYTWIQAAAGTRAGGLGYVGGTGGGVAFGLRDFWQRHPTQLDVRGAAGEAATVTVWLWAPDAGPMDLRFHHDGMGMETYPEQLEGLEITYEDYEPGFGSPVGVARTSELMLWAHAATPATDRLAHEAAALATPPMLMATPQRLHAAGVFGDWSPADRSTPARARIEDRLDFLFDFYAKQIEQRRWYGFWDHGDVMHTYDADRHVWRYDVGGYAWDNSELSTDLWLWYAFLRTGRADIFRVAEAMTRHTGEVDVYHAGTYADLGTRHGVLHWADSAKQLRISTAANRRFSYFLTADERVGDLLHDLIDADRTFLVLDPIRKIRTEPYTPDPHALAIGLGTDWGALAAAWLTEWERGGDPVARQKLLDTARTIGEMPNGFITGEGRYDLSTGRFAPAEPVVSVSHLSAVFGLVEICSELNALEDLPGFRAAWLQYCRLFNATAAEQQAEVGQSFGSLNLQQGHSRLTAYAAVHLQDPALAQRAWKEFYDGRNGYTPGLPWSSVHLDGPAVLAPVDEAPWVSTNATAQYGLAAIQNLALIGDQIPDQPGG